MKDVLRIKGAGVSGTLTVEPGTSVERLIQLLSPAGSMTGPQKRDFARQVAGEVMRTIEDLGAGLELAGEMAEVMDPSLAAGYLKTTVKALEHLRQKGGGPPFRKVSGKIRYHIDDLRRWYLGHELVSEDQEAQDDEPREEKSHAED